MMWRRLKDRFAARSFRIILAGTNSLALIIFVGLLIKGRPILSQKSILELLFSCEWRPLKGQFGFFPFIIGTVEVTALALFLAIPICLLSAIYLAEYARPRIRDFLRPIIDILAGIPSVIYGLWGVIFIVPVIRWLGQATGHVTSGYNLLSGAIVLAIMTFPFIISVTTEVLLTVPREAREVSLSLGTTRWETVKFVVLKTARRGVIAAIVLGFARAFGETMAVLMVVGNVAKVPHSLFDPAYPLPALIANNYGEMMSIPLYDSALMLAALILFIIVTIFNLGAHLTLLRMERRA